VEGSEAGTVFSAGLLRAFFDRLIKKSPHGET